MLVRVQKIIADSGYCSRRKAEDLIARKKVLVNNKMIKLGDKADPDVDRIEVESFLIPKAKKVYLALNKPTGCITTSNDDFGRKKVTDLIDPSLGRVFAVGRLDRDASGLLFLTNDGEWGNKVMHPRYEVEKEYLATLDKPFKDRDKVIIERGLKLDDGLVKGKIMSAKKKEVVIVLHEGRNKIVKRIFNELGYNVDKLVRMRIGKIRLGDLKRGKYRFLREFEIASFK